MPTYKIVNRLHGVSGLPEDDYLNVLHFDTSEGPLVPETAHALNGHVAAALNTLGAFFGHQVSRTVAPTVHAYNPAGGSPIATDTWAAPPAAPGGTTALPGEVACCLSFHADLTGVPEEAPDDPDSDTAPERPAARRRGRLFIGPLNLSVISHVANRPRPAGPFVTALLDAAEQLANPTDPVLTAVDTTWVVRSDSGFGGSTYEIVEAWVDDAFDTQRRRGEGPTTRTVRVL